MFNLTTRSLFRCHCACYGSCLLSRVSGMIVQSLSVKLVRKSTQLTVHPTHTVLILHCTRQQFPVFDIRSSREIDQCNTECKMSFSSSLGQRPVIIRISRDVFQGLVQVIRFQCRYRQVEIQFTSSFQISQHFLGTCQICKCWRRKFV